MTRTRFRTIRPDLDHLVKDIAWGEIQLRRRPTLVRNPDVAVCSRVVSRPLLAYWTPIVYCWQQDSFMSSAVVRNDMATARLVIPSAGHAPLLARELGWAHATESVVSRDHSVSAATVCCSETASKLIM